ncbi:MAG: (Fe-S)-binding protein [Deltaproteobacteria bacterium]|nr:(Fe-S)-binding protein [Deltaproteobacteria bacterium]
MAETLKIQKDNETPLKDLLLEESKWSGNLQDCMICGRCLSVCPLAGYDGMDPRKLVRLVLLGMEQDVIKSDWIWQCTTCDRCTNVCPMNVKIGNLVTRARNMVPKDKKPGGAQKTCNLHRDTGNNMQIKTEDWLDTLDWMREELEDEIPDLEVPIDKKGARYFATINSKLPNYHPDELQDIYKVFHAAKVDWTMPSIWWEGTNYCMFSGDLETWEHNLRQQVKKVEELEIPVMAYTECGHGYFATVHGYKLFGIKPKFEVIHVVKLYAKWIREGRFKLDPSKNPQRVTLHDPCNVGRKAVMNGYPDILDDARFVLDNVCADWKESWPNRENNICCSGGGGTLISGFRNARMFYGKSKVDQIDRTGAELVCTPCVNCYDGIGDLAKEYKRPWKPIHLWRLLARAIVL